MKIRSFILTIAGTILVPAIVFGYISPGKPYGYVSDYAGIISKDTVQSITLKLDQLEKNTGVEIAVATVPSLGSDTIENYAVKIFQEWGIGQKGKDNGLLLIVAPSEHSVRIEVGYGLEGTITDLQSGNIIRSIILPSFRNGDYSLGIDVAVDALIGIIKKDPTITAQYSQVSQSVKSKKGSIDFSALFFVVIIVLNMLSKVLGKTKSWWLGGVIGAILGAVTGLIWGFVYVGLVTMGILTVLGLLFDYVVSKNPPSSGKGGGFWPLFFGGGGSGGGFGGFGGGRSGGGGSSGSW